MQTLFERAGCMLAVVTFAAAMTACGDDTATPVTTNSESPPDMGTGDTPDVGGADTAGADRDVGRTDPYPDFSFPPVPRDVDTQVSSPVRAGSVLDVRCRLLDERGDVVQPEMPPEFSVAVAPAGSFQRMGDDFVATRVGTGTVRCAVPELGLVDATPATVEILPGSPHTSVIDVDKNQMVAGETVAATCTFRDEWGNEVDPVEAGLEPELNVTPSGGGIDVVGFDATITVADVYAMSCFVPGLSVEQSVDVEVVPDVPATIVANAVPNQPVYGLGQVVTINWVVSDQYGNVIHNAKVTTSASPTAGSQTFGNGRYRFYEEGTYTVTVTVDGAPGGPLETTVTIVVNGEGPAISCDDPLDGSMVDVTPGQTLTFEGSVADANGIQSVLVNGSGVTVEADGTFSANVQVDWGMNFVELVATDEFDEENSRTCIFLASDEWQPQSSHMDGAVVLKLLQAAIDDMSRTGSITSIADLLHTVLNSQGILDEVDAALLAANPLQPFTCESESCAFGICICWFGWGVTYLGQLRVGDRSVSLDLVDGGIRANALIEDLGVYVRVDYVVSGISGSTEGWVDLDYVDVDLTIDLFLDANNNPRASIRPGSVSVEVGGVSTSFSGLDGALIDFVVWLFEEDVADLIAATLQGFIEDSFDDVIDGLVSSLDINTLGSTFQVPRLDSADTVDVQFNLRFSSLDLNTSRMAVGIGTRFRPGVTRNSNPTLGVPMQHADPFTIPPSTQPVLVGVYVGLLNHVLHALWRGGLFDATLTGSGLGGELPDGAGATIATSLPPVVENLSDGTVKLGLGGMQVALTYPGIFDDPLHVSLGAVASSSVSVVNEELVFANISIDELYFSTSQVSLDATTRGIIEDFLREIIQEFVDTSLNQSLPSLPVPSFAIPNSLSQYGLPANAELGITNPTLDTTVRQYILEGTFGVR